MTTLSRLGIGAGLLAAASIAALAQERTFVANPVISAGLTGGGDTIASYDIHLGDVKAGGTLYYYGGVNLGWPRRHVGLVLQGGRFVTTTSDYDFTTLGWLERWPIEAIAFYERKSIRGGIGLVRHLSPTFEDESGTGIELGFPDATGLADPGRIPVPALLAERPICVHGLRDTVRNDRREPYWRRIHVALRSAQGRRVGTYSARADPADEALTPDPEMLTGG